VLVHIGTAPTKQRRRQRWYRWHIDIWNAREKYRWLPNDPKRHLVPVALVSSKQSFAPKHTLADNDSGFFSGTEPGYFDEFVCPILSCGRPPC
jgi:hypothetical protein